MTIEIVTERRKRRRHRHSLVIGGRVVGRVERSLRRLLERLREIISRLRGNGYRPAPVERRFT